MEPFKKYAKNTITEMRPYVYGEDWIGQRISVSPPDRDNGSPILGDMIARNPLNPKDQWLVAQKFFEENYEPII